MNELTVCYQFEGFEYHTVKFDEYITVGNFLEEVRLNNDLPHKIYAYLCGCKLSEDQLLKNFLKYPDTDVLTVSENSNLFEKKEENKIFGTNCLKGPINHFFLTQ